LNTLEFLKAQAAKLDKTGPLPLYYQIKQQLKSAIEAAHLNPDESLPSERELVELYGVSRPTVRQATEELLSEGFLYRRKGLGTFVARPKFKQELATVLGFTEQMLREGKRPSNQLISAGPVKGAEVTILEHLNLLPDSLIFHLKRLRLANGEPIMLESSHLPLDQFPKLPQVDFSQVSLYQFLREEYQVTIARLRETLEPVVLRDSESKLLKVERGSPAMRVMISAYAADGRAIEYSQALVRGDRCQYYLELETGEGGHSPGARVVLSPVDLVYGAIS
jgi:GntR family transcriptional regulator